jgi:Lon protease-like protein
MVCHLLLSKMEQQTLTPSNSSLSSSGAASQQSGSQTPTNPSSDSRNETTQSLDVHPSKRRKLGSSSGNTNGSSGSEASSNNGREASVLKKSLLIKHEVLECPLCQALLYEPVTTSCGHTFCKSCVLRVMDHTNKCPMCRTVIYVTPDSAVNTVLQKVIVLNFPEEHLARQKEIIQDLHDQKVNLPLFLLGETILMPESSLPLHVFEPRYRLMIRRCLEGGRRFGIVPQINGKLAEIGTTAIIENHWVLPDGRSLIATVGDLRFRVLDSWDQDGYVVAKVDYIYDESLPENGDERRQIEERIQSKFDEAKQLFFQKFSPTTVQQIQEKLSKIPDNPFGFTWWLAYVLPVPVEKKYAILQTRTIEDRLTKLTAYLRGLDLTETE